MAGALDLATPLLSIAFTVTNQTAPVGSRILMLSVQTVPEQTAVETPDFNVTCETPCMYPQVKLATQFLLTVAEHFGKWLKLKFHFSVTVVPEAAEATGVFPAHPTRNSAIKTAITLIAPSPSTLSHRSIPSHEAFLHL